MLWLHQIDTFPTKCEGCRSERVSIRDNTNFVSSFIWKCGNIQHASMVHMA
ncbi:hypothetical protein Gotri_007649 [Gossypium trilobum]|uniref:Uncharacterized protein n=1 Tax=Gossypium trilobum TaxID=34281 RepID=A0A7J9EID1_9ROSI|nr:hypothetical protein [Gossypium trilobum]